jgi:hypothetical protein
LYHDTVDTLSIGEPSVAKQGLPEQFSVEKRRVEKFLDEEKPQGTLSRLSCWFARGNPAHAAIYINAEAKDPAAVPSH